MEGALQTSMGAMRPTRWRLSGLGALGVKADRSKKRREESTRGWTQRGPAGAPLHSHPQTQLSLSHAAESGGSTQEAGAHR